MKYESIYRIEWLFTEIKNNIISLTQECFVLCARLKVEIAQVVREKKGKMLLRNLQELITDRIVRDPSA